MQHVLQNGLKAGLSATEGIHSNKPNPVDPSFDGLKYVLPKDFIPEGKTRITLKGKYDNVEIAPFSIGAWAWGDTATWQWKPEEEQSLKAAWKLLYDAGLNYIDTAQAYGSGESERICGSLVKDLPRDSYVMQTKYYVVPDNLTNIFTPKTAPLKFLKNSLERMNLDFVDVYMIHGPIHLGSIAQVAASAAECVEQKLAKVIAVGNYSAEDMVTMKTELAKVGVPLALNQVEFNLLRRIPETGGLLQTCREEGIQLQSYSSLAQGRLTGKYDAENPPPETHRFSSYDMKEVQPVLEVLKTIADKRGVSVSAVALNYNMGKGVNPVVGVRSEHMAKENLEALGWRLTDEEYQELDKVSFKGKETKLWQQG